MRSCSWTLLLWLLVASPGFAQDTAQNIMFIVDGSGSMWGRIEGETKIEITQKVLAQRIKKLPPEVSAGLIAYGHRREKDCNDIETLVDLAPVNHDALLAKLAGIRPKSMTPIASSIELAVAKLKDRQGESSIILMTDGRETCDADPCATVKKLKTTSSFSLHVVGFDIVDEEDSLQLQCLAGAGGGNYFTAATIEGLDEAFRKATGLGEGASDVVQENVEIVLDTSAAMLEPFDGTTRLEAATDALRSVLEMQVADRDNLAFRRFGGPCEGDNTELVFEFGRNIAFKISGSLYGMRGGGETTLIDATNAAIFDFDPPDKYQGVSKRILIITGGNDPCYAHDQAASLIRQRLANRNINPEFRFIGIALPPDKELELKRIADVTGGEISIVQSRAELEGQLERILEVEPAAKDIDVITANFNHLVERVDVAVDLIEKKAYEQAAKEIERLHDVPEHATLAFRDLGRRKSSDEFIALFNTARGLQSIQTEMVTAVEGLLAFHRSGDADSYNKSARVYNELTTRYAELAEDAGAIIRRLRENGEPETN